MAQKISPPKRVVIVLKTTTMWTPPPGVRNAFITVAGGVGGDISPGSWSEIYKLNYDGTMFDRIIVAGGEVDTQRYQTSDCFWYNLENMGDYGFLYCSVGGGGYSTGGVYEEPGIVTIMYDRA